MALPETIQEQTGTTIDGQPIYGGVYKNQYTDPTSPTYIKPLGSTTTSSESRDKISDAVDGLNQAIAPLQNQSGQNFFWKDANETIEQYHERTKPYIKPEKPQDKQPGEPTAPILSPEEKQRRDTANAELDRAMAELDELNRYNDPYADPSFANSLSMYNRQFDDLRKDTEAYNSRVEALQEKLGIMSGTQRYSPAVAGGEVLQRAVEGLKKIQRIEDQRRSAITSAYDDMKAKRWDRMYKRVELAGKLREQVANQIKAETDRMKEERKATAEATKSALENEKLGLEIQEKSIASIASLADSALSAFEESGDLDGGVKVLQDLATQYGVDANKLLSAVQKARAANKAWSKPYQMPGIGTVQTNAQTGEVRTISPTSQVTDGVNIVETPQNAPYVNAFNSVLLGLPSASQKIATKTFKEYVEEGDFGSARNYIVRMATQGLPAADQTQALGRAQATASLKEIQQLLNNAKQLGTDTNLLQGSLVNIAQKLGTSTNTDLSYIAARIQQQLQVYRRSMTGVAFSPNESAEYAKIFPDITNVEKLNAAKIQALSDAFDSNNRASLAFLIGESNYDALFGTKNMPLLPSAGGGVNIENKGTTSSGIGWTIEP